MNVMAGFSAVCSWLGSLTEQAMAGYSTGIKEQLMTA